MGIWLVFLQISSENGAEFLYQLLVYPSQHFQFNKFPRYPTHKLLIKFYFSRKCLTVHLDFKQSKRWFFHSVYSDQIKRKSINIFHFPFTVFAVLSPSIGKKPINKIVIMYETRIFIVITMLKFRLNADAVFEYNGKELPFKKNAICTF